MKLSCQENVADGATFAEKVERIGKYGFEGIELFGGPLFDQAAADERVRILADSPVKMSSSCGGFDAEIIHPDPRRRQICVDKLKHLLDFAARVHAVGVISVPIFNFNDRLPDLSPWKTRHELDIEMLIVQLRDVAAHAHAGGVSLLLEPLNRYESDTLKNIAEAAKVCAAVDNKGASVMADLFHMHIEETNTPAAIEAVGASIGHVHMADNTRLEPGTGDIDFTAAFGALKRINYGGYMAFECGLSDKPSVALPKSVEFLRQCIADAK